MSPRVTFTALLIACSPTPALAHAFLQHADPGAGATLKAPPRRIMLSFSEELEPVFSGVAVTDSSGRSVEAGSVMIRGKSMMATLRPLPAGKYRVTWHVVS